MKRHGWSVSFWPGSFCYGDSTRIPARPRTGGVGRCLHIGEGGLPQFPERSQLPEGSVQVEDGIWVRRRKSTPRITFGFYAAHTVLRILGRRRPTWYPSRRHPSWSLTTKATLFRPGRRKRARVPMAFQRTRHQRGLQRVSSGFGERGRETKQSASLPNDNKFSSSRRKANL